MASFSGGGWEDQQVHLSTTADDHKINDKTVSGGNRDNKKASVSPQQQQQEEEASGVLQVDSSTIALMFELAVQKNEAPQYRHALLERHEHFHFKGIHPHPTYSIRFGTSQSVSGGDQEPPPRLWAQRHLMAKEPYYVISASPQDMDVSKKERSKFFLGKLKESHGARCFTGFSCAKDNCEQRPTLCVVYDHERAAGEKKMEVGIPLPEEDDPSSKSLEEDFNFVRREGTQNHSLSSHPVAFFHQRDDSPDAMSNPEVLQKFVINDSACATQTSTKNFQLVVSSASRGNVLSSTPGADIKHVLNVRDDEVLVQMGKIDNNIFTCAYRSPFTLLQVFMMCLSRFETKQCY